MSDRERRATLYAWVYENNQWGRSPVGARYYSDSPTSATASYRAVVEAFLREHPDIETVVDLGCGDFQVSRETDLGGRTYVGVDIYDRLIEHNTAQFGDERHTFLTRDLVEDELPPGDLCLICMVLYLMSHRDVLEILPKLRRYPYVLITDGQPDQSVEARRNVDQPTGKYTPLDLNGAGFYLELPPFNLPITVVSEYPLPSSELVRTVLLHNPGSVTGRAGAPCHGC